jgi:hypothetical protein
MKHILLFSLLLLSLSYKAATFNSAATNSSWVSAASWTVVTGTDADGIPDNDDDIVILNGHTINLASGNNFGKTLTINSGGGLRGGSGTFLKLYGSFSNSGTITGGLPLYINNSGTATISSTTSLPVYVLAALTSTVSIAAGTSINGGTVGIVQIRNNSRLINNGTIVCNTISTLGTTGNSMINANGSSVTINASIPYSNLTLTNNSTSTFIMNSGATSIYNCTYSNLTLAGSGTTKTALATITTNGTLTVNSGVTMDLAGFTLNLKGNLSNSGTLANLTTLQLSGTTNQTLSTSSALTIPTLSETNTNTIILSSGTYNMSSAPTFAGSLTLNSGSTFNLNNNTLSLAGNLSNSGTISNLLDASFNGTSAQTISSTQGLAFDDLTTSNAMGVTFTAGAYTITNSLTVSSGNLNVGAGLVTLTSDATKTAYIANSGGTMSGSMIIQRYVSARAANYHDFSSPVASTTINDWDDEMYMSIGAPNDVPGYPGGDGSANGDYSVFTYNNATAAYDNVYTGATLTPGLGYDIFLGDNLTTWPGRTIDTRGTPNMGSKSLPVVFGADGWNLVGNPHAAFIDWSTVVSASTQLDATVYILDNSGNYQSYTNPTIPPGQGFFCYINNGTGTAVVNQNAKTTSTSSTFNRSAAMPENGLRLRLSSSANPYYHEIELFFDKKSAVGFEKGKDMPFFKSRMLQAPNITFMDGATKFTRNYVSAEANTLIIPMELNTPVDGNYTIDLEGLYASGEYTSAYFVNTVTNEKYEIYDGKPVTIYFNAEAPRSSFNLVLSRIAAGAAMAADENVSIFSTSENINIKGMLETTAPAKVEVFNLMGQLVLEGSAELNGQVNSISTQSLSPAVYVVKVTTADNRQFSKKIAVTK